LARDRHDASLELERVAKALDGHYMRHAQQGLPSNFADLRQLGVDETIIDLLAALVAGNVTEELVVRAFLEALESPAKQAGASRQLLRALRNQFKAADECAELRAAVATIVAAPIAAGSPAP
jgi:predicted RNA-binding Zn ribbon-like protein